MSEKKQTSTSSQNHLQMYHSLMIIIIIIITLLLLHHSSVCFSSHKLRRMQFLQVLVNKNKIAEFFFIPLFIIKMKQKDASAVVRLPRQGKKHSYNLLRSRDYRTQSAPWGPAGSPSEGNTAAPETESLCSIKEHFSYVFTLKNKKLKRYSFTGKIHNPKLWNC